MLDINFNQIIEMIEKWKNNAYRKVNEEMILLYLEVGKFLIVMDKQLPTINKTIDEEDYPNTKILDTYSLEFLDLPNEFSRKRL